MLATNIYNAERVKKSSFKWYRLLCDKACAWFIELLLH